MSNYDLSETSLLKWQAVLSFVFIGTIVISIIITYNEILKNEGKDPFLSKDDEVMLIRLRRNVALLIAIGFLLINIIDMKIHDNEDLRRDYILQIISGILSVIGSFIVLFTGDEIQDPEL